MSIRHSLPSVFLASLLLGACGDEATPTGADASAGINDDASGTNGDVDGQPPTDLGTFELPGEDDGSTEPADAEDGGVPPDDIDSGTSDVEGSGADADVTDPGVTAWCRTDSDCDDSGPCIFLVDGYDTGVCFVPCLTNQECVSGQSCEVLEETGADQVQACLPDVFCVDFDGDGWGEGPDCTGRDCDDELASVNFGAPELCDGLDNNCDELIDNDPRDEGDECDTGFSGPCSAGRRACVNSALECVSLTSPEPELCDDIDNDCDNVVDPDSASDAPVWYRDVDNDGYGDPDQTRTACSQPDGFVENGRDCDDSTNLISPDAPEVCDNVDNNCDGNTDEDNATDARRWYADADTDGFGDLTVSILACNQPDGFVTDNTDCDDNAIDINPAAVEVCDNVDNNCADGVDESTANGATDWYADADTDGFGNPFISRRACTQPDGYVNNSRDCDDANITVNPDAIEACDTIDNNCSGEADEGEATDSRTWYRDSDTDSFGDPDNTLLRCTRPEGYVANDQDCDDSNEQVRPTAAEVCDTIDNNCNDLVDEDTAEDAATWYLDQDNDTFGDRLVSIRACAQPDGYVSDARDCDDNRTLTNPDATEFCNLRDDDCDGDTDENDAADALTWYLDSDRDGAGDPAISIVACNRPPRYVEDGNDCDDARDDVRPGAFEACDSIDNNCNELIDENGRTPWYIDRDEDGYGSAADQVEACAAPDGYVNNAADCNDSNEFINPAADEVCDGVDNNCVDGIDEPAASDATTWYRDADTDTWGNTLVVLRACTQPVGYVARSGDCNDAATAVNPSATEVCDSIDNNCTAGIDEDTAANASIWYADADTDSYGNPAVTRRACNRPSGYVANNQDCDDTSRPVNPAALEACDNIDNDCDSAIDEGEAVGARTWYRDADTDSYGTPTITLLRCNQPGGYVANALDCNDSSSAISPVATEICDSIDNNCNNLIDENVVPTWYLDSDGDGYGRTNSTITQCAQPAGYAPRGGDCEDRSARLAPGVAEVCDGSDNNCNGRADEGGVCIAGCRGITRVTGGILTGYSFCTGSLGWQQSRSSCQANSSRMSLAVINDSAENSWLWNNASTGFGGDGWDDCWVGGTDQDTENRWEWLRDDNQYFFNAGNNTVRPGWFASWKPGEPNNDNDGGEDCLEFEEERVRDADNVLTYWNDAICTRANYYVCEWLP